MLRRQAGDSFGSDAGKLASELHGFLDRVENGGRDNLKIVFTAAFLEDAAADIEEARTELRRQLRRGSRLLKHLREQYPG